MYIVYEEHIQTLEEENEELKQEILFLRQRLKYFNAIEDEEVINS
tara:strand:+ start:171 stop:305 length:135 start_codon:yes stop_codon:yes gene_type:complete